jgi:hypothetical protein
METLLAPDLPAGYAFEGNTIRLTHTQFAKWEKAYPHIDLMARLQVCDDYYSENPPRDGKWFARVSNWLERDNAEAKAKGAQRDTRTAWQRELDEVCPPHIYKGLL